jgi:threonine dehydratase
VTPPSFDDILAAAERLRGHAYETPLLRNDALDALVGGRVFVKAEALQRTGSFKFRGAYNRLSQLTEAERGRGVVAFSSGNHAQGVALAARLLDVSATIVMPADAPALKIEATRGYGAEVALYDRWTESREAIGARLVEERGAVLVPPFEDPHVIAGQGTAGLEAARQLQQAGAQANVALCCTSGGGVVAGIATALEALSPATKVFAVEPEGFDDTARSLAAGEPVTVMPMRTSLCDALLVPRPGDLTFSINRRLLAGAVAVSDEEALAAMAFAFRHLKLVLEPGGAVALAAALTGKLDLAGRTTLVIATGGNVDPALFSRAIGSAI